MAWLAALHPLSARSLLGQLVANCVTHLGSEKNVATHQSVVPLCINFGCSGRRNNRFQAQPRGVLLLAPSKCSQGTSLRKFLKWWIKLLFFQIEASRLAIFQACFCATAAGMNITPAHEKHSGKRYQTLC
ncbi:hypothetical protein K439DRAFT_1614605 [Ramaria rubella]|nr:hypothetical protein K439DRAFT_1614605 [Ramaria rubella]